LRLTPPNQHYHLFHSHQNPPGPTQCNCKTFAVLCGIGRGRVQSLSLRKLKCVVNLIISSLYICIFFADV
jgi:hypothetical protein